MPGLPGEILLDKPLQGPGKAQGHNDLDDIGDDVGDDTHAQHGGQGDSALGIGVHHQEPGDQYILFHRSSP